MLIATLLAMAINICNLDLIYNDEFKYSLPRAILAKFLIGTEFGRKEPYTEDEQKRLEADINDIYQRIIARNPYSDLKAVMTAGAPGAGKTWLMRAQLDPHSAYTDPDDVCLKEMHETYLAELTLGEKNIPEEGWKKLRFDLYTKWRPGSNAANQIILANLIRQHISFYFGTTSTSPQAKLLFKFLKDHGYHIKLLHISAPDDVRWASIQERDKTFVQTTEEDTRDKGKMLPERIKDTYLAFSDEIEFYFRYGVHESGVLAATWIRDKGLTVHDQKAYDAIRKVHNAVCTDVLHREDILWENVFSE